MFPQGQNGQLPAGTQAPVMPTQQAAPVFAPAAGPQQQPQSQPQQQPVQPYYYQPTQPAQFQQPAPGQGQFNPQQPTMPLVAPNPNNPVAPVQQAPAQQQNQPNQAYQQIYQSLAQTLKTTPEAMQQAIQDNPQVMASLVHDAIMTIRNNNNAAQQIPANQPNQQPGQGQAQVPTDGKISIPQAAYNFILKNEKGMFVASDPAYQQYANIANHNEMIDRSKQQQFLQNPTAIFDDPAFQQKISQQVESQVQQRMAAQEAANQRTSFREKHGRELVQLDPNGQMMKSPMDGSPLLTPLGFSFDQWARKLHAQGMKESSDMYATALTMAKSELGLNQPAQQQQPQQFQPAAGLFGQQIQQQAQWGQQQPPPQQFQQPNLTALMQQNLTNANSYWPGQPPARTNMPNPNMSIEGALTLALQDVPEGGDMNTYFNRIGPSLFN